jgi:hypothetical protein
MKITEVESRRIYLGSLLNPSIPEGNELRDCEIALGMAGAAPKERAEAARRCEARDLARKTKGSEKKRILDVDVSELVVLFDVEDQTELKLRLWACPLELYAKLLGAAQRIAALFHARPRLTFEPAAIIVRIQTKLEAAEADRLYDQLLDTWWLANVHVEDQMSLTIDFV